MILRHLVVQRRVYHRRRQVRAAGTTNRFMDKDPHSQPSVSSRQSRKTVACIQERRLGLPHLATSLHLLPACLYTAGQGLLPLSLHYNLWRGSRKCPEWRSLCMLRELYNLREEFPFELSSSAADTRHGLFERRPRQLEPELFNDQRRLSKEILAARAGIVERDRSCLCRGYNISTSRSSV